MSLQILCLLIWRSKAYRVLALILMFCSWQAFPSDTVDVFSLVLMAGAGRQFAMDDLLIPQLNAVWLSITTTVVYGTLITSLGVIVARGWLAHTAEHRIWILLASTPVSRVRWLLTHWLAQVLMLSTLFIPAILTALLRQRILAPEHGIQLMPLLSLFLFAVVPAAVFAATAAIITDLIPATRRAAGSLLFVFLWGLCVFKLAGWLPAQGAPAWLCALTDINSYQWLQQQAVSSMTQMPEGLHVHQADFLVGGLLDLVVLKQQPVMSGWHISTTQWLGHGLWLLIAPCVVALLALRAEHWMTVRLHQKKSLLDHMQWRIRWPAHWPHWLDAALWSRLWLAEILLMLSSRNLWWWLLVLASVAGQLFLNQQIQPSGGKISLAALALLAGWSLGLDWLSRAPLREQEQDTKRLVFSCDAAHGSLLCARLMAVCSLMLLLGLPFLMRNMLQDQATAIWQLAQTISLVLCASVISLLLRDHRVVELSFTLLVWLAYEGLPVLDVQRVTSDQQTGWLLAAGMALVLLPAIWRRAAHRQR